SRPSQGLLDDFAEDHVMSLQFLLEIPIGLGPVIVFLIILERLDSFCLVTFYNIAPMIGAGGVLAALSYALNGWAMDALHVNLGIYTRYVSPVIEETLKAGVIIYLFS